MPPIAAVVGTMVGLFLTVVTIYFGYLVLLSERQLQHRPAALQARE